MALYAATLAWYQYRRKYFGAANWLLLMYMALAIVSWISYYQPPIRLAYPEHLTFGPLCFLWAMVVLSMQPIMSCREEKVRFELKDHWLNYLPLAVIGVFGVLLLLAEIKELWPILHDIIFTDEGGRLAYASSSEASRHVGDGASNIPSIVCNIFADVAVLFIFYLLTQKKVKKWLVAGLMLLVLMSAITDVTSGGRGNVVWKMENIVFGFFLFMPQFPPARLQKLKRALLIGVCVLALPVVAITISRFTNQGRSSVQSVVWYTGQSMLYFDYAAMDAGGIRYGDRTANLFKRQLVDDVPENYVIRREKYPHLKIDDYIFYTFVGDFTIDYGNVPAVLIFIAFACLFLLLTRPRGNVLESHQVILLFFCMSVVAQGSVGLFSYADIGGNLRIVAILLCYLYYHIVNKRVLRFLPE